MTVKTLTRAAILAPVAALILFVGSVPAFADSFASTTGASGRVTSCGDGTQCFYATDTLSDGHCARWQQSQDNFAHWTWIGASACSGHEEYVYTTFIAQYEMRICRTGVGNCSAYLTFSN